MFRVWRRRGERQDPANVVECDGNGGGSVMVWGRISYEGKTDLKIDWGPLNAARCCAVIILTAVVPYIHNGNADVFSRIMHVVILPFSHVTSWWQTTLTRSNGLPNHQNLPHVGPHWPLIARAQLQSTFFMTSSVPWMGPHTLTRQTTHKQYRWTLFCCYPGKRRTLEILTFLRIFILTPMWNIEILRNIHSKWRMFCWNV